MESNGQNTVTYNSMAEERMPEDVLKIVKDIFKTPSTKRNELSIAIKIIQYLSEFELDFEIDNYGNILVSKGHTEHYPCFCSHMDTVHNYEDGFSLYIQRYDNRDYLLAMNDNGKFVGCGGDDHAGIATCIYLLRELENVKVAFFSQEESGGVGSKNVKSKFFEDIAFIGSIDRWGGCDFITSHGSGDSISTDFKNDVKNIIDKYGYKETSGLFTDCWNVQDKVNISAFNVSCGYYKHHSDFEFQDLSELWHCMKLCKNIAFLANKKYSYEKPKYTNNYGGRHSYNDDWWSNRYNNSVNYYEKKFENEDKKEKKGKYKNSIKAALKEASSTSKVVEKKSTVYVDPKLSDHKKYCRMCGQILSKGEIVYCYYCENKYGVLYP